MAIDFFPHLKKERTTEYPMTQRKAVGRANEARRKSKELPTDATGENAIDPTKLPTDATGKSAIDP